MRKEHALPTTPSKQIIKREICTSLGGVFDMAFHQDQGGLYECPMNERNVVEIVSFIKPFEKRGEAILND